ncbi:uncharacterized protein [Asterias amurensis]|uniref:uncharacterized protein isoform X1 n=1 Tax=Asterias amurensis TaxID=7602 RepID=UPI003AB1C6A3
MASVTDTDSLSGIDALDSTATSPLLNALATNEDLLSPASQLSSLRASLAQSTGNLLKGSSNDDSPEFRLNNPSTLTESSLEKHNVSNHQPQPSFRQDVGTNRGRGISLPNTPFSNIDQGYQQSLRLPATADSKEAKHSSQSRTQAFHHQANRQLFSNQSTKTTTASSFRTDSHVLNASAGSSKTFGNHQDLQTIKPEQYSHHQKLGSSDKNLAGLQEMEQVRRSLYHMIQHNTTSRPRLERDSLESKESVGDLLATHGGEENGFSRESFESNRTDSLLGPHTYQDVSPLAMDSGLGLTSLKNLSGMHIPAAMSSRDNSLYAENQMLKDYLEKERYRRKHCESQIGEVQAKLLETQQQLAVAISTDRKKDAMIEQLDKTLARIVDGWRKQEQEKDDALQRLMEEKKEIAQQMEELRKAYEESQSELNQAKEKLGRELQQAMQVHQDTVTQLLTLQEEQSKVKDQLISEQKILAQAQKQRDGEMEERHRLEKQVKQVQHMLAEERQQSQTLRKEFQERSQQFEKERQQLLDKNKAKSSKEARNEELLATKEQELEKLKNEFNSVSRDKENSQLELTLQQAKFEAAQQKQEAHWQEKLEKCIDERLRELQLRSSHSEAELRESHRKQLAELTDHHQKQFGQQRAAHSQELANRDKKLSDQTQQYQTRLEQHHQDMTGMTKLLEKAQKQRSQLVQRLQGVQVFCTDALSQMNNASPLIKDLKSTREVLGGGVSDKIKGTRPLASPITISVSSPQRGVGVGGGELDSKHEHEDGDGREDNSFHVPNFSLSTTAASQSPPSQDPFNPHTNPTNPSHNNPRDFTHRQDIPVSLYTQFMEDVTATRDGKVEGFSSQNNNSVSSGRFPAPVITNTQDRQYGVIASVDKKFSSHQDYQYPVADPNPITFTGVVGDQWEGSIKSNPVANTFPSQDLISSGLQMLKMTPPSSHSSPLRDETPRGPESRAPRGLEGVTLGDILRVTGGWGGLRERRGEREEDFRDFREIQPTLDDTKTTSKLKDSIAAYPSEDETISELESGPIPHESSNILLERLAEHKERQSALQHYIQMLLQQPPDSAESGSHITTDSRQVVTKETVRISNQKEGMVTWQELVPSNQSQGHAANAVLARQGTANHGAHQTPHTQVDPGVNQTSHTHVNPRPNQASHTQGDRGAQPVSHSQGNSKTNQTKGMPHHSQTRADHKSKSSASGGRQSIDKQSAKPKLQSTSQSQVSRTSRSQKVTAATRPTRQVTASTSTQRKVAGGRITRN